MTTILDKIVAAKRKEVDSAKASFPIEKILTQLESAPPPRDFLAALSSSGPIKLIAEIKKASPSKGIIRESFNPVEIARIYQDHGATCLSVLTDKPYFQGDIEYLKQVRSTVNLPILRKDFILDSYQLVEARAAGADAVLLIAECLDDCNLRKLRNETIELGMTPLVEFYELENLSRVLETGAELIGVNNRNLKTFETNLRHSILLRDKIPGECIMVGESGIHSYDDALLLQDAGIQAMLVGEHLMASENIGQAVDSLLGR